MDYMTAKHNLDAALTDLWLHILDKEDVWACIYDFAEAYTESYVAQTT